MECYQDIRFNLNPFQGSLQLVQPLQKNSTEAKCLIECQGMYADVFKTEIEKAELFGEDLLLQYRKFKRGFIEKIKYPNSIIGNY